MLKELAVEQFETGNINGDGIVGDPLVAGVGPQWHSLRL